MVAIAHIAHVSKSGQITIPEDLRTELHLEPGQPLEVLVHEGGVLIRPIDIDPEQAWFWTPEWQAKEWEADADIAAGRTEFHDSDDSFLAALRERAVRADP